MHQAYIGLGSNLGDSRDVLQTAWTRLAGAPDISCLALSAPYRTEPVDMETTHWFVNAVGFLETNLSPNELLDQLHLLEHKAGRQRLGGVSGYQDRILDLDLLLYDDFVIKTSVLSLPHPQMTRRVFVLKPLAEICPPDLLHPETGLSMHHYLHRCLCENPDYQIRKMQWKRG